MHATGAIVSLPHGPGAPDGLSLTTPGRRLVQLLAVGCALGLACSAPVHPNVVLIFVDDLGYHDLGAYGQRDFRTPHIDALAAAGIRFTDAYSSTVCAPARHMLLTGRDPGHAFSRGNSRIRLPAGTRTLGHVLQRAGYRTAVIGKWGLGGPGSSGDPLEQGFDYAFGYMDHASAHDYFAGPLYRNGEEVPRDGTRWSHTLFERDTLAWLDENAARGPFFLYLPYTLPHRKLQVPSTAPYTDEPWTPEEKKYAAMIHRLDVTVGRVTAKLKELGVAERTLVIFMSDNGASHESLSYRFESNAPLRGAKRDLYEGGIRVPAIVSWPGTVLAGRVDGTPWAVWDVLPTICDLTGAACPEPVEGISIAPVLFGERVARDHLYWEFHQLHYGKAFKQAVRRGRWKGVRIHGRNGPGWGGLQLFDLAEDVGERHDLAAAHPEIVRAMERWMLEDRVATREHRSPLDVHAFEEILVQQGERRLRSEGGEPTIGAGTDAFGRWTFEHAGGGFYRLVNRGDGRWLASTDGRSVRLADGDAVGDAALWSIVRVDGRWSFLVHAGTGRKLRALPGGSRLALVDSGEDEAVRWDLLPLPWL